MKTIFNPKLLCSFLSITLITAFGVGCGKQNQTVQSDNIQANTTIMYSGGWGDKTPTFSLSYDINGEMQGTNTPEKMKDMIVSAMGVWNTAIGKTILKLDTTKTFDKTGNDLNNISDCTYSNQILYQVFCLAGNSIIQDRAAHSDWSDKNKAYKDYQSGWLHNTGKDSGILATTVWQSSGSSIISAHMRLNRTNYMFGDTSKDSDFFEDNNMKTIVDFKTLLVHELGHVLGFGHNNEIDSVMQPTMNIGPDATNPHSGSTVSTIRTKLSPCDVDRALVVYSKGYVANSVCLY